jgi:hypothetical protein
MSTTIFLQNGMTADDMATSLLEKTLGRWWCAGFCHESLQGFLEDAPSS